MSTESKHATTTEPSENIAATKREGCCGGPAPAGTEGCCALDAQVKSSGGSGCGCAPEKAAKKTGCC
jgi:hypothetical protein